MVQIPWTLRFIHEQVPDLRVHVQWQPFAEQQDGLLLWEVFVSGAAKGETHEEDARSGVQAFCEQLPNPGDPTAEETERPFSVLAAATVGRGSTYRSKTCAVDVWLYARLTRRTHRSRQRQTDASRAKR
jgi:hypothetical protein